MCVGESRCVLVSSGVSRCTLSEQEVRHEGSLEGGLSELQSVWNLPQQQLHNDQQLVNLERERNIQMFIRTSLCACVCWCVG